MAKRELSSTLKNLKFMQRATQRVEKTQKEEETKPDGNFASPTLIKQKCVVIMEGDPHPGAVRGRMSFLNFNPSIDKLNEDADECGQSEGSAATPGLQSGKPSDRENDLSKNKSGITEMDMHSPDGDLKRKQQPGEATEFLHPNKLQKNGNGDPEPSSGAKKSSNKQSKREQLDWNVLRPSKGKDKKGLGDYGNNLRETFQKGIIWQVGDGKTIKMWKDNWIQEMPLIDSINLKDGVDPNEKVEGCMNEDGTWNQDKLTQNLPENIVRKILNIAIPLGPLQDRMYWRTNPNGWFSAASAIEVITKQENLNRCNFEWIWEIDTNPKNKEFHVENGIGWTSHQHTTGWKRNSCPDVMFLL